LFKTGQKPVDFQGNFKYQELHDFLNVYSEIFVFKGEENSESAAAKPWLSEPLPELQQVSHKDLCFEKSGTCVILVLDQAPTQE